MLFQHITMYGHVYLCNAHMMLMCIAKFVFTLTSMQPVSKVMFVKVRIDEEENPCQTLLYIYMYVYVYILFCVILELHITGFRGHV